MLRSSPTSPPTVRIVIVAALLGALPIGCATTTPYTLDPIKTTDPDTRPTPRPEESTESMYWDRIDLSVFHQLEKPLNLNWTGRTLGRTLGIADADEADNVNVMDEPPNSSWWKRRHFYDEMTQRALAIGPNERDTTGIAAGPAQDEPWIVTGGKSQGAGRGFQIKDARGNRYLIKLDGPDWPELATSAEVISTKIFYAVGYHVPQNTITYFSPDDLTIAEDATIEEANVEQPMTRQDLERLLAPYERRADGTIRALASKFISGDILGPFWFRGTRDGDANDRVRHEQRRELRGLRVISSWLNDADRRAANTLAVYTDEHYVKHYLLDMGSTLGANASGVHRAIHGQAYMIDQRKIPQALFAFGAYRFPWWDYDTTVPYKAVGYYRADVFEPGDWVPTYPNPAFEKLTARDGYWGAKMVMSFRGKDLATIVETADISNPNAEAHLLDVLSSRRDEIGRYWFDKVPPLDRFSVSSGSAQRHEGSNSTRWPAAASLDFADLSVEWDLEPAAERHYSYRIFLHDQPLATAVTVQESRVPLAVDGRPLEEVLTLRNGSASERRVVRIELRIQQNEEVSGVTQVYVHVPKAGRPRVVGLRRD